MIIEKQNAVPCLQPINYCMGRGCHNADSCLAVKSYQENWKAKAKARTLTKEKYELFKALEIIKRDGYCEYRTYDDEDRATISAKRNKRKGLQITKPLTREYLWWLRDLVGIIKKEIGQDAYIARIKRMRNGNLAHHFIVVRTIPPNYEITNDKSVY